MVVGESLILVGAVVGLVNGLLIVKGRLNGFIVTLGMTIVLAGLQKRRLGCDPVGLVQNILELTNVSNYWVEAVDGAVILFALLLASVVGGETTAEE